jgi:hypothetical protein
MRGLTFRDVSLGRVALWICDIELDSAEAGAEDASLADGAGGAVDLLPVDAIDPVERRKRGLLVNNLDPQASKQARK